MAVTNAFTVFTWGAGVKGIYIHTYTHTYAHTHIYAHIQVAVTNAFTVFTWGAGVKGQSGPLGGKDGLTRPRQMLHLGIGVHTVCIVHSCICIYIWY